jgi:hypothetical protein
MNVAGLPNLTFYTDRVRRASYGARRHGRLTQSLGVRQ